MRRGTLGGMSTPRADPPPIAPRAKPGSYFLRAISGSTTGPKAAEPVPLNPVAAPNIVAAVTVQIARLPRTRPNQFSIALNASSAKPLTSIDIPIKINKGAANRR